HEVLRALDAGQIKIHDIIRLRNPDLGKKTFFGNATAKFIDTTAGRCIFNEVWPHELGFHNNHADKKSLGLLVKTCFDVVGRERTVVVLDELKDLGYEYATRAGFSIGVDDMIIPAEKVKRIGEATKEVLQVNGQREQGIITEQERYNKCVDIWTQTNNDLAGLLVGVLEQNNGKEEINPIFAMLDSGARGSKDQIKQLAGMRGLMSKPSGEIIERPILSNFREGLTVLEYFISSHGARKGLADTALKTADSGYMTRKLVDVSQDVISVERDCGTVNGIVVSAITQGEDELLPLKDRIVGRFSVEDIHDPVLAKGTLIVGAGQEITPEITKRMVELGIETVRIRSVLTCESRRGICAKCYGRNLATGDLPQDGDALGILAAQSIGEPGTQLTMRTFHYGGTAAATFKQPMIKAREGGLLRLEEVSSVELKDGSLVVLNKKGYVVLEREEGIETERYELIPGAQISKGIGQAVKKGEVFVRWDPYNIPIITRTAGRVEYRDLVEGVTLKRELSQAGGTEEVTVMEHREDLHPQLVIFDDEGAVLDHYSLPGGAHIMAAEGGQVEIGTTLARTPRQSIRNKDIVGGLPRVAELFEARRPKEAAEIARIDGLVELGKIVRGKRTIVIRDPENDQLEEHTIPAGKRTIVFDGDFVRKGQPLTDGAVVLQELLEVCGPQDLQTYIVNQVQEVYRLQGVEINDKHVETIVRQMMRKVRITEPGGTRFLFGETVDRHVFREENERVNAEGGEPAKAQPVLMGITKASLETDSFISAASFQDTTRVLTESATLGAVDTLRGFKENVIMGHLIPAGTGFKTVKELRLEKVGTPDEMELPTSAKAEVVSPAAADKLAQAKAFLDL
ncbi:MAG: DNA-directed RNA polymerase subunit beta', partial [bacterium]